MLRQVRGLKRVLGVSLAARSGRRPDPLHRRVRARPPVHIKEGDRESGQQVRKQSSDWSTMASSNTTGWGRSREASKRGTRSAKTWRRSHRRRCRRRVWRVVGSRRAKRRTQVSGDVVGVAVALAESPLELRPFRRRCSILVPATTAASRGMADSSSLPVRCAGP